MQRAIQTRYHQVKGFYRRQAKLQYLSTQLPKDLHHCLDLLIAQDIASLFIVVLLQLTAAITRDREGFQVAICMHSSHSTNSLSDPITHRHVTGLTKCQQNLKEGNCLSAFIQNCLTKLTLLLTDPIMRKSTIILLISYFDHHLSHLLTVPAANRHTRRSRDCVRIVFQAASKPNILLNVQAIHRTMASKPATPNVVRTIRNRRFLHYLLFCFHMNLTDDWLLVENQSQARANFQLKLYATHLATGSSLHFKTIKPSTIDCYLRDVATLLRWYCPIDPRFVSTADTTLSLVIAKVLAEQRRWESIPNRRKPFIIELHNSIANTPMARIDDCCLAAAMTNWTLCNLYAGCLGIEWDQTSPTIHGSLSTFHRNRFGNVYDAFTLADVQCFTTSTSPIPIEQAIAFPSTVAKIKLRLDEQKSGENGEWKLFTRNSTNPPLCFVSNFVSILQRHKKLTNSCPVTPLSVYRGDTNGVPWNNITTVDIETVIHTKAAATVYNLDPIKHRRELMLWLSNSLHVGACTLLYSKGFSEMEIKYLLRWKSNAFMTYLRNFSLTSHRQTKQSTTSVKFLILCKLPIIPRSTSHLSLTTVPILLSCTVYLLGCKIQYMYLGSNL